MDTRNGTQRGTSNDNCLFIDVWSAQFGWLEAKEEEGTSLSKEEQDGMTEGNETGTENKTKKTFSGGGGRCIYKTRGRKFNFERGIYIHMKNGERENGFPIYVTNIQTQKRPKRNKNLEIKKGKEKRIA